MRFLFIYKFFINIVVGRVIIPVMKYHDQRNLGRKKVFSVYASTSQFIIKGLQDRNPKRSRNLKAGADVEAVEESGAAHWLALQKCLAWHAFLD